MVNVLNFGILDVLVSQTQKDFLLNRFYNRRELLLWGSSKMPQNPEIQHVHQYDWRHDFVIIRIPLISTNKHYKEIHTASIIQQLMEYWSHQFCNLKLETLWDIFPVGCIV